MFTPIQKLLNSHLQKRGIARQVQASLVCAEVDKLIANLWGEAGTASARALYLKNNILTVACLSSSMAQEIRLHEDEIIMAINKKFGPVVERLSYQL